MAYISIQPDDYFNAVAWTGTSSSPVNVTGFGHNPDAIWNKYRSGAGDWQQYDSVRGATKMIVSNSTNAESTNSNGVTAFISDGFTAGSDINVNGGLSCAWGWKAGTTSGISGGTITPSSYSISAASGFGIYKYTGTGSAGTIAHGLSSKPTFILVKKLSEAANWTIYYNPAYGLNGQENRAIYFNTDGFATSSTYWNGTAATSSVFSLGTTSLVNESGHTYIAYAFADVKGYQKFIGWYANASTNGPFLYTGFKPKFFLMFNINNAGRWMLADSTRNPANEIDGRLSPHQNSAEAASGDIACDFLSNGIKIRGGSTSNINSANLNMMYGLAIAEEPLVSSNGVPATAR